MRSPSAVRKIPLLVRLNNVLPSSVSRLFTEADSAGWEICSVSAALLMECRRVISTRWLNCSSRMAHAPSSMSFHMEKAIW